MARAKTKPFTKSEGVFYFNVKTRDMNITVKRKDFQDAKKAFFNYVRQGKKCEWLGRWNGKKFEPVEDVNSMAAAVA